MSVKGGSTVCVTCMYICMYAYISVCISVTVSMCTHALYAHGHIKFVNAGEECACSCVLT